MPIRKHRAGWQIRIQFGGRRVERTIGGTKADAKAFEARLRREFVETRVGPARSRTIEEALARWLKGEAMAMKSYESLLDKVAQIRRFVAGKPLDDIADAAQAIREDGLARGLRPATINRRLAILRRVARLAANEWAWTDRNLGARVKMLPGERARRVMLSAGQVSALLRACPDAQTRSAVLLASLTSQACARANYSGWVHSITAQERSCWMLTRKPAALASLRFDPRSTRSPSVYRSVLAIRNCASDSRGFSRSKETSNSLIIGARSRNRTGMTD